MPPRSQTLRLVATYVVDWLFVVALGVGTLLVNKVESKARPFSLTNPSISFPFTVEETVPMSTLVIMLIAACFPGILLGTTIPAAWYSFRGGSAAPTAQSKSAIWRRALWEFHIVILGLLATGIVTIFVTESLKVMIGKPRPDCIARCQPDLTRMSEFVVGGIANQVGTGQLVSKAICTGTDHEKVNDGFKSWPSGHSSGAAAGFGYLSLFLAGKFGLLSLASPWSNNLTPKAVFSSSRTHARLPSGDDFNEDDNKLRRNLSTSSAPALSLSIIAFVPYAVGIFVAASRWLDYRHHAADILSGFALGSFFAAVGYRFSQLHVTRALGPQPLSAPSAVTMVSNTRSHDADKEWRVVPDEEEGLDARQPSDAMKPLTASTAYRPQTGTAYIGSLR